LDTGDQPVPTYTRVSDLGDMNVPWGRVIQLQDVEYTGGETMLRLRIREGRRITDLELTAEIADELGRKMLSWAKASSSGATDAGD
jgi:Family of unknown function (DUF6967)